MGEDLGALGVCLGEGDLGAGMGVDLAPAAEAWSKDAQIPPGSGNRSED